jgi:hypothetical protein
MRGTLRSDPDEPNIPQLLSEAADLSRRAAELAGNGQVYEALDLERQADILRNQARHAAASPAHRSVSRPPESIPERGPNLRSNVIAALGEIGVPSSPRSVADYVAARFGSSIDHRALPSLRRDERRAWLSQRSMRAVYIVPALEGNRFLPVRAKLALSDWPLERRLIGPWSERVDHLNATIQIAKQMAWLERVEPSAAGRLRVLLAAYAATIPGAAHGDTIDPEKVEPAASAELAEIGQLDAQWRGEAAERARGFLNEEQVIWGGSLPVVINRRA